MSRSLSTVGAIALALIISAPLSANTPVTHPPFDLSQVYPCSECPAVSFEGYGGAQQVDECALPGFFDIVPGSFDWSNYVSAAQGGVTYTIKSIALEKRTPELAQCADVFPTKVITQSGSGNIRLRWPLMYEVPGTVWTLTITYGTPTAVNLPGELPGTASYVHQDVWRWSLVTGVEDMKNLLVLFRELPFGTDEVPLISDESLYIALQAKLDSVEAALATGETARAAELLADFELEVMDACITESPALPNPGGPGTGIANTAENPACCKLLADAESLFFSGPPASLGIASISTQPAYLWPTDGRMTAVNISYDLLGAPPVKSRIASVTCNETIKEPDWRGLNGDYRIYDPHRVYLKAARTDKWKDRVYTVTIEATDARGQTSTAQVEVRAPRVPR